MRVCVCVCVCVCFVCCVCVCVCVCVCALFSFSLSLSLCLSSYYTISVWCGAITLTQMRRKQRGANMLRSALMQQTQTADVDDEFQTSPYKARMRKVPLYAHPTEYAPVSRETQFEYQLRSTYTNVNAFHAAFCKDSPLPANKTNAKWKAIDVLRLLDDESSLYDVNPKLAKEYVENRQQWLSDKDLTSLRATAKKIAKQINRSSSSTRSGKAPAPALVSQTQHHLHTKQIPTIKNSTMFENHDPER